MKIAPLEFSYEQYFGIVSLQAVGILILLICVPVNTGDDEITELFFQNIDETHRQVERKDSYSREFRPLSLEF